MADTFFYQMKGFLKKILTDWNSSFAGNTGLAKTAAHPSVNSVFFLQTFRKACLICFAFLFVMSAFGCNGTGRAALHTGSTAAVLQAVFIVPLVGSLRRLQRHLRYDSDRITAQLGGIAYRTG